MDNMLSIEFASPADICHSIAQRSRAARLAADLSQEGLAERSGVSLGTLKRFEHTGAASLEVVVRIALALRLESGFEGLFVLPKFTSLDEVIATPRKRLRGKKK
jgi:transcriptional regulator with XRE-family HTH domain